MQRTIDLKERTRLDYSTVLFDPMISLLELPNELLLLISTTLKSDEDLSHLLQVNHRLYDLLLPCLYQQNVEFSEGEGLFKCATDGNEKGVRHFLHWGAYVDVQPMSEFRRRETENRFPPVLLPSRVSRVLTKALPMPPRQTPLSIAANGGHDAIVKLLLDHGAQLNNDVNEEGSWEGQRYPAVKALLAGHESTLRLLLESGAQTEGPHLLYGGLINCAVASGQMPMLKLLMQFGVDVNAQVRGISPLFWAVRRKPNYASLVEVLLDHGADIALADDDRGRLIREALQKGTIETVDLLLRRGANLHASMLSLAASRCTLETVRLLLDHGARVSLASVMRAVNSSNCDILELLLGRGFDLNERTPEGYTVLHHAIHCCDIRPPIRPNLCCIRPPIRRQHPVIEGCDGGNVSTPTLVFPQGASPLHVAAYCRKEGDDSGTPEEIVKCLIRWGADVNVMDGERQTPLYYAWKYASPAVQHMLLENGADWTAMLTIY